ncbi:MAG: hypothetical protein IJN67_10475 [Oscillospiraceae bacterium]|nr:hypothetical protein [Oscillospiraceae bacterium]
MNPYIKQLKEQLPGCFMWHQEQEVQTVSEMLYGYYQERHPLDTEEMDRAFCALDGVLQKLTAEEYDKVWYLTCSLCGEHEKNGFLTGLRIGACLAAELMENKAE